MKNVIISGARGFIGSALCNRLGYDNKVIGVDITEAPPSGVLNIVWEQGDFSDEVLVAPILRKHSPDAVIHCAGIVH